MGLLTTLAAVEQSSFMDLKRRKKLSSLYEHLNQERSPEDTPLAQAVTARLSLDKTWDDIEVLMRTVFKPLARKHDGDRAILGDRWKKQFLFLKLQSVPSIREQHFFYLRPDVCLLAVELHKRLFFWTLDERKVTNSERRSLRVATPSISWATSKTSFQTKAQVPANSNALEKTFAEMKSYLAECVTRSPTQYRTYAGTEWQLDFLEYVWNGYINLIRFLWSTIHCETKDGEDGWRTKPPFVVGLTG